MRNRSLKPVLCSILFLLLATACQPTSATVTSSIVITRAITRELPNGIDPAGPQPIALVNGTLIDGTGAGPLKDAVVLLQGERIAAVGKHDTIRLPASARIIDVQGGTILPGFINAHVHQAFDAERLATWANAGITTVRDEGLQGQDLAGQIKRRDTRLNQPEYARIISTGKMITVPKGYGALFITSVEEARKAVESELADGADLIKIALEDGYAGQRGLAKLTPEEINTIVQAAHEHGTRVSAHITQSAYAEQMIAAGVDDIAHTPYDTLSDTAVAEMVKKNISMNTTFTVLKYYNGLGVSVDNLRRFVQAGGQVVMGNDFVTFSDVFETGMPMYEFQKMQEAGMSPMQMILAATRNAARACNQEQNLGTLEKGKIADVLVLRGDPLKDLNALKDVFLVIHQGKPITE